MNILKLLLSIIFISSSMTYTFVVRNPLTKTVMLNGSTAGVKRQTLAIIKKNTERKISGKVGDQKLLEFNAIHPLEGIFGKPYSLNTYTPTDLESDNLIFEVQPDFSIVNISSTSPSSSSTPTTIASTKTIAPTTVPTATTEESKIEKAREEVSLFPGLKKINDDLYVGEVPEKFYLAMERVTPETIDNWLRYAKMQVATGERMTLKSLPTLDGSQHFSLVLEQYSSNVINQKLNELWVAYASDVPVTKKAKLNLHDGDNNPNIEMFVTIITSPDALVTSHMGISRTWEAALGLDNKRRTKHADQSLHLHSFAAKVIKSQDPKKVYMLTAPAVAMRAIILKKMPEGSVFVGDSLYQQELEEAEKDSEKSLYEYYKIPEKLLLLKSNPPRILRTRDGKQQTFTIQKPDGSPLVTFDQSSSIYQWMFTRAYNDMGLFLPYVLTNLDALAKFGKLVVN